MTRRVGLLLAGSLLFWGLVAYPAYLLGGKKGLVWSAVASGLCLVPAMGTMVWAEWAFRKSPEHYLFMVLGGTGVRMFAVLGGVVALQMNLPYFRQSGFLLWVGLFYFASLALEIGLMLVGRTTVGEPVHTSRSGSVEQRQ